MMELPHYLMLLARTSFSNLNLLSMEPPQSPKFNVPLWQPWVSSPTKETPSTASSGESEGDRTLSPEAPRSSQPKELTGKWKRERRSIRLPDYKPREGKMALRSQSFNERRAAPSILRAQPHSDGEELESCDDVEETMNGGNDNESEYSTCKSEAPIDMRLRTRAPPPYARPTVITKSDTPNSMSMCDPVIDEHFRRSLGDDYMNLFKKTNITNEAAQPGPKPNTKDRASSPIQFKNDETPPTPSPKPAKIIAMDVDDASLSVDDHFAKALGDTWKKIQTSRIKETDKTPSKVVDDHFSKALGDTWNKIQSAKPVSQDSSKPKDQTTKIITRSGVVI